MTTLPVRALLLGERIERGRRESDRPIAASPVVLSVGGGQAVLFRYGAVVLFGVAPEDEAPFLAGLGDQIVDAVTPPEEERVTVAVDPAAAEPILPDGTMVLRELSLPRMLIVADVLAKSVLLAHYERRIAGVFDGIEPLARTLQRRGRRNARGRALLRQVGDVLMTLHQMVGRAEVTEKPDVLWDHPGLERVHARLAEEYELRDRSVALDRKLDLVSRTLQTLLDLDQQDRSLRVEWYIVALIVIEIGLTLYEMFLKPPHP
ncbi:MAG: RMD1 family protein [Alphaproteobacteria bacterium]|nr:RMD1 family protein [Alphaproteobacteria bacterium]